MPVRCSAEGKFQGFEDEMDISVDSAEAEEEEVMVELTLNRLCAGCGTECATANITISIPFEHECPKEDDDEVDHGFEIENGFDDPQQVDDYQTTVARGKSAGKRISNPRYQKHLLGASISGTIKCQACGEEIELEGEETITASDFEVEPSH